MKKELMIDVQSLSEHDENNIKKSIPFKCCIIKSNLSYKLDTQWYWDSVRFDNESVWNRAAMIIL